MPQMVFRVAADLEEFRANFAEMKAQAETTLASMRRMANAFDGSKIIADANAAVIQINKLGGATALTAKEQKIANATLTEAIEKYRLLGRTAPAEMVKLEAATRAVEKPLGLLSSMVAKFGPMLAATFSVGAITSGARALVSWADDLDEVANGLETNVVELQKFQYALNTTGSSSAAGTKAIQEMQKNLEKNAASLAKLGLSLDTLPEDSIARFYAITDALKGVKSEQDYARLGAELFGKTWKSVSIAVRNDMHETAEEAAALTEEEIRSIAKLQSVYDATILRTKVAAGRVLSNLQVFLPGGIAATNAYASYQDLFGALGGPGVSGPPAVRSITGALPPVLAGDSDISDLDAKSRELKKKLEDTAKRLTTLAATESASWMSYIRELSSGSIDAARLFQSIPTKSMFERRTAVPLTSWWTDFTGLPGGMAGSANIMNSDVQQALAFATWGNVGGGSLNTPPPGLYASKLGLGTAGGGLLGAMNSAPMAMLQALLNGGGYSGAAKGIVSSLAGDYATTGFSRVFGSIPGKIGGFLNQFAPGVGSLVGGGIGWLASKIGGLFGPSKTDRANAAATDQIGQQQSALGMSQAAVAALDKQLGTDLAGMWGSQGVRGLQEWTAELNRFNAGLETNKRLIADLAALEPGELLAQSVRAQIASGTLTDEARSAVGGFITSQTGTLADTVKAYVEGGGSLEGGAGRGIFSAGAAAVGQMRQNGMSLADIAASLGPTLGTISGATGQSNSLIDLINTAGAPEVAAILKSSDQLGTVAVTMDNLGLMTQDSFSDLTSGLYDQLTALQEFTETSDDAARLMQGSLQKVWEMTQEGKLAADANLQAVLDAAQAQGIIGAAFMSSEDQLRGSIDHLIAAMNANTAALGGEPAAFNPGTGAAGSSSGGSSYGVRASGGTAVLGPGEINITVVSQLNDREVGRGMARVIPDLLWGAGY